MSKLLIVSLLTLAPAFAQSPPVAAPVVPPPPAPAISDKARADLFLAQLRLAQSKLDQIARETASAAEIQRAADVIVKSCPGVTRAADLDLVCPAPPKTP